MFFCFPATSSGNERRKRKKRRSVSRRESATPKVPHDSGIVAQMLASEDTLLRMCLRRGNYPQAQQVGSSYNYGLYHILTCQL